MHSFAAKRSASRLQIGRSLASGSHRISWALQQLLRGTGGRAAMRPAIVVRTLVPPSVSGPWSRRRCQDPGPAVGVRTLVPPSVSGPWSPPVLPAPGVQSLLKGATSGFVLEYRPAGLGYQSHTCIVIRSGCQKVNLAPVFGFAAGQVLAFLSGMKVPSLKWQAAGNRPNVASGSGGVAGILVQTHSRAPSCQVRPC